MQTGHGRAALVVTGRMVRQPHRGVGHPWVTPDVLVQGRRRVLVTYPIPRRVADESEGTQPGVIGPIFCLRVGCHRVGFVGADIVTGSRPGTL